MKTHRRGLPRLEPFLFVALVSACSSADKHRNAVLAEAGVPEASSPLGTGGVPGDSGPSPGGAPTTGGVANAGGKSSTGGTPSRDAGPSPDASDASSTVVGVYVDSTNGVDTNSGTTAAAAFKTFAKAVATAKAGETIFAADGLYNSASEGGSVTIAIPDGVSVQAEHEGLAVIGGLPMTANGASGTLSGLTFDQGSSLSAVDSVDASPALTLSHLRFISASAYSSTLGIGGNTQVTMVAPQFSGYLRFGVLNLFGAAQLLMNGGTFDAGGVGAPGYGASLIIASGTTKLTLDGVSMKNALTPGIGAAGSSPATPIVVTLRNGTLFDTVGSTGNCGAGASVILSANANLFVDNSQIKNAPGAGICVRNNVTNSVNVDIRNGSVLTNDDRAIGSEIGTGSVMTLTMDGATLASNTAGGIYWAGWGNFDIKNTTFDQNAIGMYLTTSMPVGLVVRGSSFTTNGYGAQVLLSAGGSTLDLGTAASPGGNTFTGSTTTSMSFNVPVAQDVNASGNTWAASTEGADGNGHYSVGNQVTGPVANGTNYRLTNASKIVF